MGGLVGFVLVGIALLSLFYIPPSGAAKTPVDLGRKWLAWGCVLVPAVYFNAWPQYQSSAGALGAAVGALLFIAPISFSLGWLYGRAFKFSKASSLSSAPIASLTPSSAQPATNQTSTYSTVTANPVPHAPAVQPLSSAVKAGEQHIGIPAEPLVVDENAIYAAIANELKTGATNESLWTRLYAECDGDENRTKVAYIKHRAARLMSAEQARYEEQERLSTSAPSLEKTPYEIIARRRCKVCNLDVASGYISDENICIYCDEELKPKNAPRVTTPNPVSTKVTAPNPVSAKASAQLDASDDFGDRMKALHKITSTDMCSAGECERHADLRLSGKLYCLGHYHTAKSAMEGHNPGIRSSLNPAAAWPFPSNVIAKVLPSNVITEVLVFLDLETTGLNPGKGCRVIEVGAVRVVDGVEVERYTSLVHPGKLVSDKITEITGISNEMLTRAPTAEKVMPELASFIADAIVVAHNAQFDHKFLKSEFGRLNLSVPNKVACTLEIARKVVPGLPNYKLGAVADHLGVTLKADAHRALPDARQAFHIWRALQKMLRDKGKPTAIAQFVEVM